MTRSKRKSEPLLSSIEIARALGAESVTSSQKRSSDGRSYIEVISIAKKGRISKKRIYRLNKKVAKNFVLMVTVNGSNFLECIYLAGQTDWKDFWKQVCGYRHNKPNPPNYPHLISFYKKNRKSER